MKQRPIKLASQPVLSLEVIAEQAESPKPSHISADHWDSLLRAADFDSEERAFICANKLERIARRKLPEYLGWQPRQVEAVRVRVQRRFRELKENRLDVSVYEYECALASAYGSTFMEILPSGRRVWSMNLAGADPLARRKDISVKNVLVERSKTASLMTISEETKLESPETRLRDAQMLSAKVWGQHEKAGEDLAARESELATARQALQRDEEDALIEDRKPKGKLVAALSDAETAAQEAARRVDACARAYRRSLEAIAAIEAEIAETRFQRLVGEIAPDAAKFRTLIDEAMTLSLRLNGTLRKFSAGSTGVDLIFPPTNPQNRTEGFVLRSHKAELFYAMLSLVDAEFRYGVRKAG